MAGLEPKSGALSIRPHGLSWVLGKSELTQICKACCNKQTNYWSEDDIFTLPTLLIFHIFVDESRICLIYSCVLYIIQIQLFRQVRGGSKINLQYFDTELAPWLMAEITKNIFNNPKSVLREVT